MILHHENHISHTTLKRHTYNLLYHTLKHSSQIQNLILLQRLCFSVRLIHTKFYTSSVKIKLNSIGTMLPILNHGNSTYHQIEL